MPPGKESLDEVHLFIRSLSSNERMRVYTCINEIKDVVFKYKELGVIAISLIGAELSADKET